MRELIRTSGTTSREKETLVNNVFHINHRATGRVILGERFGTTSEGSFGLSNERHLTTPF